MWRAAGHLCYLSNLSTTSTVCSISRLGVLLSGESGNRPPGGTGERFHSFTLHRIQSTKSEVSLYVDSYICPRAGPQESKSVRPERGTIAHKIYDSMACRSKSSKLPRRCALFLPPPALRRVYLRPPCASSGCQPSPPGPAGRLWGRRRWQPPPLPPPPPLPRRPPSRRYRSPVASTRGGAAR